METLEPELAPHAKRAITYHTTGCSWKEPTANAPKRGRTLHARAVAAGKPGWEEVKGQRLAPGAPACGGRPPLAAPRAARFGMKRAPRAGEKLRPGDARGGAGVVRLGSPPSPWARLGVGPREPTPARRCVCLSEGIGQTRIRCHARSSCGVRSGSVSGACRIESAHARARADQGMARQRGEANRRSDSGCARVKGEDIARALSGVRVLKMMGPAAGEQHWCVLGPVQGCGSGQGWTYPP